MSLTPGKLLLLAVLIGGGVFAWMKFGRSVEVKVDPYSKADTFFTGAMYEKAATAYQAALTEDPNSPRAAEAMFRIGFCFQKLERNSDALRAYEAYIQKFPNHEQVKRAEQHITKFRLENVR